MSNPPLDSRDLSEALHGLADHARRRPECPDEDEIWGAQEGKLDRERTVAMIEHTTTCPACAERWRVARAMGAMEDRVAGESPSRAASRRWLPLAAAAGLVLVLIGFGVVRQSGPPEVPTLRSGALDSIRSLVPEDEPLPRGAFVLRWSPGPDGTVYRIRVTTEQFVTLVTVEALEQAEYRLAESDLVDVESGARLMWQVEAFLPDGRSVVSDTWFAVVE